MVGEQLVGEGCGGETLLLTAHPDDECMFFTPAILCLRPRGTLRLLCLSTGAVSPLAHEWTAWSLG